MKKKRENARKIYYGFKNSYHLHAINTNLCVDFVLLLLLAHESRYEWFHNAGIIRNMAKENVQW